MREETAADSRPPQKIKFPAERTTLIIDPPRRGCDDVFLTQLLRLRPRLVVYVSCNVHTQARDIGQILRGEPRYEVVSACGADVSARMNREDTGSDGPCRSSSQ